MPEHKQPCYQNVKDCTYWTVFGYFNNWNVIKLSQKATFSDDIYKIHQVVIDGISDNIAALVQTGQYCAINKKDTTTKGYYVIKYFL